MVCFFGDIITNEAKSKIDEFIKQKREDELVWENAKQKNTKAAYENYLSKFSDGRYRKEAINKLNIVKNKFYFSLLKAFMLMAAIILLLYFYNIYREETLWHKVSDKDKIINYKIYIDKYPNGRYRLEAEKRINRIIDENKFWKRINEDNSTLSYQQYINKYPKGKFTEQAKSILEKMLREEDDIWKKTTILNTLTSYNEYLSRYPDGKYSKKANIKIEEIKEDIYWKKTKRVNTVNEYNKYLKKYSYNGKYIKDAKDAIKKLIEKDEKDWIIAKKRNTLLSYKHYLYDHPNGKHSREALNKEVFELKWNFNTGNKIESSPSISNGLIYFGDNSGNFYALNQYDGSFKWKYEAEGGSINAPFVLLDGNVYFCTENGHLYAIEQNSGSLKWSYYQRIPLFSFNSSITTLNNDILFYYIQYLLLLDRKNGKLKNAYKLQSSITTVPIHSVQTNLLFFKSDIIYYGDRDGYMNALNSSNKKLEWRYETADAIQSTPVISNGIIYFGSDDGYLYALNKENGKIISNFKTNGSIKSSPIVSNGIVYFGSDDGKFYAVQKVRVKDVKLPTNIWAIL